MHNNRYMKMLERYWNDGTVFYELKDVNRKEGSYSSL